MVRRAIVSAVCGLLLLCSSPFLVHAQQQTTASPQQYALQPFTSIVTCLPFNVLIKPSQDTSTHTLSAAVDPEVSAALRASVQSGGILYLGFNRSFESTAPIKVTISLPAGSLAAVENRGVGAVILNPGFTQTKSVTLTTSAGSILARGLNTPQLLVKASGTSEVFARGDIKAATVNADGTSTVTVSGVTQSLAATLSGISKAYVDAASDAVAITTKAEGLSKLYYNKGKCDSGKPQGSPSRFSLFDDDNEEDSPFFSMSLDLGGIFGGSCVKITDEGEYPAYQALWSCGLRVRGASVCVPGDVAAQDAAAQAASIRVVSATAPNSQASAAASSGPTPAPTPGPSTTNTAPTPPPATTNTASATSTNSAFTTTTTEAGQKKKAAPELVASAADIRVAAAGRRKLHQAPRMPGVNGMFSAGAFSSSSHSSASSMGGRNEAVAVASLECDVPLAELYIGA